MLVTEKVFREIKTQNDFRYRKHLDYPAHIHEDIEIVYVAEGEGAAFCEGKKYDLSPGMFFISFPNQIHYYENWDPNGKYFLMIFKPSMLLQYISIFDDRIPDSPVFTCGKDMKDILQLIELFDNEEKTHQNDLQSAYVTLIFGKFLRHINLVERSLTRDNVSKVINYCSKHYKEDISIGTVANALNISKSYVSYIFGRYLLINFREYVNGLRISEAMKLIERENLTMTEISGMVGFNTLRTFNRAFSIKNAMTPTEYKNIVKLKK